MNWFVELVHRDGSVISRTPVLSDSFRIGRALDNDLVLDDPHTAHHHACLRVLPDGTAALDDLGSINGIALHPGKTTPTIAITGEQPVRIGQSLLRVRSSDWPLTPERPLAQRVVWPWALVALSAALAYSGWELWLRDLNDKSPPYLYGLSGFAAAICAWSAAYALFGRLIAGIDRFFSHLLIASSGFLIAAAMDQAMKLLAFSSGWVWPLQSSPYAMIAVLALLVRQHLRLADPRHWHATRWAVLVVTAAAFLVPLAQTWITQHRLSDIQTMNEIAHPAWRLARPVPLTVLSNQAANLKSRLDNARLAPASENEWDPEEDD